MIKKIFSILFYIMLFFLLLGCSPGEPSENQIEEIVPQDEINETSKEDNYCENFFSPFIEEQRDDYANIEKRLLDKYGAYRNRGHKHSAIDLKGDSAEKIYSIGKGTVHAYLYSFPNTAVVIKHVLADDTIIYSSYVHVADIEVEVGDTVDENTSIARLFNEDEQKRAKYKNTHLHLEIRTTMEDEGVASYSCKTIEELDKYFCNPEVFLKSHMKQSED